jgi:hypothetical protein
VKKHEYCSKEACQLARKRKWQKAKLQSDPIYRGDQQSANRDWQAKTPDYWKRYRERNKHYTERNRQQQRRRNARRRKSAGNGSPVQPIAKMDALSLKSNMISGRYMLVPLEPHVIAKMDAIIVEISTISEGYPHLGP